MEVCSHLKVLPFKRKLIYTRKIQFWNREGEVSGCKWCTKTGAKTKVNLGLSFEAFCCLWLYIHLNKNSLSCNLWQWQGEYMLSSFGLGWWTVFELWACIECRYLKKGGGVFVFLHKTLHFYYALYRYLKVCSSNTIRNYDLKCKNIKINRLLCYCHVCNFFSSWWKRDLRMTLLLCRQIWHVLKY